MLQSRGSVGLLLSSAGVSAPGAPCLDSEQSLMHLNPADTGHKYKPTAKHPFKHFWVEMDLISSLKAL